MEGEAQSPGRKASREASEWFVFLQDDPDDRALRRRFDEWLAARPQNAVAWAETLRASSLAESLLPFDARDWKRPAAASVPRSKRRWLLPVAASAAAACLLLLAAPKAILQLRSDHVTSTGQVRDIALQDGSVVTLAPSSAIAVSYTAAERQVRLLSGEAFFSVKPNAERPFRVVARAVQASVLGTGFDVQMEEQGIGVSVEHGKVRVESAGIAEVLDAGQSIRVASGNGTPHRSTQPSHTIATWRQMQLVMEDAPLSAAIGQLDRYFDGTIIVASGSLRERQVTGVFDLRDPEGALRAMAKALGAKVQKVTPWILVVSAQ